MCWRCNQAYPVLSGEWDKGFPFFEYWRDGGSGETGHAKNQKSVVHRNDVLVVRSGAPGTACVVPEHFDGCNAVDIIIARPDCNKVDPTFLAMFTNMPHGKNQIRNQIGGAAQQHYNVGGYKKLQLIAPPLPLQREFAAFVAKVDKLAFAVRKSLESAEKLYRQGTAQGPARAFPAALPGRPSGAAARPIRHSSCRTGRTLVATTDQGHRQTA